MYVKYFDVFYSYSRNQNIRVRRFYNRSGAGFMVGIIGIVVGTIAFAFGLSALILAMILQSTVNGLLGMKNTINFSFYRCQRDYF